MSISEGSAWRIIPVAIGGQTLGYSHNVLLQCRIRQDLKTPLCGHPEFTCFARNSFCQSPPSEKKQIQSLVASTFNNRFTEFLIYSHLQIRTVDEYTEEIAQRHGGSCSTKSSTGFRWVDSIIISMKYPDIKICWDSAYPLCTRRYGQGGGYITRSMAAVWSFDFMPPGSAVMSYFPMATIDNIFRDNDTSTICRQHIRSTPHFPR
ncbi:hypothetical protein ARMSODRAFT_978888 [Armillaria solidipes]|uniref:Uncharacterized protein n=1 Tax=Armillaria solidipes TaxID=1076256 RepID=A0A2H3B190_9AGAR|nr:hypothetical protein ARMSODRAFT_978888 [Armillaria solidipes]